MAFLDDPKVENVLAILGALVPLCSALASFLNHLVRDKQSKGEAVSPLLLSAGSVLNAASINLDKAVQLGKMAKGLPVPATQPSVETPAPAPEPAKQEAAPEPLVCPQCGAKIGVG